jgi:hypothetical protein
MTIMNRLLITVFCALLVNFGLIISLFVTPLLRRGFFFLIGAFFLLGLALVVLTLKQKVKGKLKFFLILTGVSAAAFVAGSVLHNLLYALSGFEEPVFSLIAVLVCPIAFLAYMGLLFPLKAYEAEMGPYTIAYESFTGPYAKTGPVFARVYEALKAEKIATVRGLGIYYDDPATVAADKLRSDCGVVIEDSDLARFNRVRGKFQVKRLARMKSVVVEFPIRTPLSYMFGPMKAYPALMRYAQAKGYKMAGSYELYDEPQGKIFFVLEVAR